MSCKDFSNLPAPSWGHFSAGRTDITYQGMSWEWGLKSTLGERVAEDKCLQAEEGLEWESWDQRFPLDNFKAKTPFRALGIILLSFTP